MDITHVFLISARLSGGIRSCGFDIIMLVKINACILYCCEGIRVMNGELRTPHIHHS